MATNTPLKWDEAGSRQFELGVQKGVLYPMADNGSYPQGVAWNGLTKITEKPEGAEANDMWADDIKYASIRSTETFGATIEAYTYPDEFAECDGSYAVTAGMYVGQQKRRAFGLCYRTRIGNDVNDDAGYKLHLVYGCTASPSQKDYETVNDSPEGINFSWDVDSTPVNVEIEGHSLKPTSCITIDSTKVDSAKLKALEDKLYGTSSEAATLPTPSEVYNLIKAA